MRSLALAAILAALLAAPARADEGGLRALAELGPELFLDEGFLALEPALAWDGESFHLELAAPLRLRLNPRMARSRGLLRREDWDALSDAGRPLRRAELSLGRGAFELSLGALAHRSLGHGTLLDGYGNALDPDRAPLGGHALAQVGPVRAELLGGDLLDPGLLAAGVSVEALSVLGRLDDRVHLTGAVAVDWGAPRTLGGAGQAVFGAGVDAAAWRGKALRLAPYLDVNGRAGGLGVHLGLLADATAGKVQLALRAEARRATGSYVPEHFDLAWALERWEPASHAASGAFTGWRAEVRASSGAFSAAASAGERLRGRTDASLVAQVAADAVEAALLVAGRGLGGAGPERLLLSSEVRWRFAGAFYAWSVARRVYQVQAEARGAPRLVPGWQLGLGLGAALAPG